jgi:hypothetical protein
MYLLVLNSSSSIGQFSSVAFVDSFFEAQMLSGVHNETGLSLRGLKNLELGPRSLSSNILRLDPSKRTTYTCIDWDVLSKYSRIDDTIASADWVVDSPILPVPSAGIATSWTPRASAS